MTSTTTQKAAQETEKAFQENHKEKNNQLG